MQSITLRRTALAIVGAALAIAVLLRLRAPRFDPHDADEALADRNERYAG